MAEPATTPTPLLRTVPEAIKMLGTTRFTFYRRLIAEGHLHIVKIGRRSYVTDAELQRYVAGLERQHLDKGA